MVLIPRVAAIVIVLAFALVVVFVMNKLKGENEKVIPQGASIVVRTIPSQHHPTDRIWSGYGTTRTMQSAQIVAEVSGRVIDRPNSIEAGISLKKGDLIIRIDDTDYINTLDAARQALKSIDAQLEGLDVEEEQTRLQVQYASEEIEAAKRDLGRIDQAIAANVGNSGERDAILAALLRSQRELAVLRQQLDLIPSRKLMLQAERSSQQANERIAQENVQRTTIRAPFDAELQSVAPRVGDRVAIGSDVARLVDLSRLEIPLKLPASASSWIKLGDEVRLWVQEPNGEADWTGTISRVAPEADVSSRTITVFAEVEQDPADSDRLLPGQFVHGRVVTHDRHDRVILPRRAVQSNTVYIAGPLENGIRLVDRAQVRVAYSFEGRRPEIDPNETQWVALEVGYEPVNNAEIIISLLDQVVEGMKVRLDSDPKPQSQIQTNSIDDEGSEP